MILKIKTETECFKKLFIYRIYNLYIHFIVKINQFTQHKTIIFSYTLRDSLPKYVFRTNIDRVAVIAEVQITYFGRFTY